MIKGWYKAVVNRSLPTARLTIEWITVELVEMYHHVPPPGENIPLYIIHFNFDNLVPTEEYIELVVRQLRSKQSRGPSNMRSEYLRHFPWEAQKAEAASAEAAEESG